MTTERSARASANLVTMNVRMPTWDIQRRRDRFVTDLCRKRMVGKHSLFCEDLGRQIHNPFLLAISRGQFCEPRTGFVKNSKADRIS